MKATLQMIECLVGVVPYGHVTYDAQQQQKHAMHSACTCDCEIHMASNPASTPFYNGYINDEYV